MENKCSNCISFELKASELPCRKCAEYINFEPKEPEQKNDFSKAKVGQELWSLRYGKVTVDRIRQRNCGLGTMRVQCIVNNVCTLWCYDGSFQKSNHQDLYWHKPKIEFQPDTVRTIRKWVVKKMNVRSFDDITNGKMLRLDVFMGVSTFDENNELVSNSQKSWENEIFTLPLNGYSDAESISKGLRLMADLIEKKCTTPNEVEE